MVYEQVLDKGKIVEPQYTSSKTSDKDYLENNMYKLTKYLIY